MCRWSFYRKIVSLATYYPFFSIYLFIDQLFYVDDLTLISLMYSIYTIP